MEQDSVAKLLREFYRLVGTESGDQHLTAHGEAPDEVAYLALTAGCRRAQRWLLRNGYQGWRSRSAALAFTGTDAEDGGRHADLPADFMQAYGTDNRSALTEPSGRLWGSEIRADEDYLSGNFFYFRGEELWLARSAQVPGTLHLNYHYMHPAWASDTTIDFPMEARRLIAAEAADYAKEQNWLPGGQDLELKIARSKIAAREDARAVCRASKTMRKMKPTRRVGNHW